MQSRHNENKSIVAEMIITTCNLPCINKLDDTVN